MKYTVMYIAIRWLRSECVRFHITILYEPNNIDMMQHLRLILNHPGWIWLVWE
jgi:hypothetical protein